MTATTNTNRRRSTYVVATSVPNHRLSKVAVLQRESSNVDERAASQMFHRKVFGLLVLQYSVILFLASPFALVESFRNRVEEHHFLLECIAIGGIVLTFVTAIVRGSIYPVTQICLVATTIFVSLEMGLSFAGGSVGKAMYIGIGQATTSFAIILALLQFELEWLTHQAATILCFMVALLWVVILVEVGNYTRAMASAISMGGFAFVCTVIFSSYHVEKHVAPEEYALATLFILFPEALLCIGAKERHVEDEGGEDEFAPLAPSASA